MPFQEYLNSLRFEHALLLLKKTDWNVTDICLESGFSDSKYLSKRLKSVFNLSIKDFKNADLNLDASAAGKWEKEFIYTPKKGLEIMRKHHHFDCDVRNFYTAKRDLRKTEE